METTTKKKTTTNSNAVKKCVICSRQYGEQNVDKHMHSYFHHKAIERIYGSKQVHKCWACDKSMNALQQYQDHIGSSKHKGNLSRLQCKRRQKQNLTVDYNTELELYKTQTPKKQRHQQKCFVCCNSFETQDLDQHMHSFVHHQAIERLKGSKQLHKCWACNRSLMGLEEYKKHISTDYHKNQMLILIKGNDKSTVDYSAEFDDELKALCAQRDHQKHLKKKEGLLKWMTTKQKKLLKNSQMKNTSQSVKTPIPAKAGQDFTSDDLPVLCNLFSSWDKRQKISTSRPDQTVLKRKQESIAMDNFNCPLVKRPCPPSETFAHVSGESTCAPELVQRDDVSILLRTIRKSLDQGVNVGSGENVESHTKDVGGQTCKSNRKKKLKEKNKQSKKKENEKKKGPAKQKRSKKSVSIQGSEKSKGEPCLHDAFITLKPSQPDKLITKKQKEQCMSRDNINGQETPVASLSSVTSQDEKIERFHSQTSATYNVNVCQILDLGGNDSCRTETDTHRERINWCNAETSGEDLMSFQTISCSLRKNQVNLNTTHQNPETTCRKNEVNKLMTLSSREEELTNSLRNVGDQLFQAYATLQNAYTDVQHLLTVKQQVSSEMSSLRAKRIQLLQDMME